MKKFFPKVAKVATVAVLIFAGPVQPTFASLQTWHLENVTFDDGGTASGFLSVDTTGLPLCCASFPIVDLSITSTAGTKITSPFDYTLMTVRSDELFTGTALHVSVHSVDGQRALSLIAQGNADDLGMHLLFNKGDQINSVESVLGGDVVRLVTAGSIVITSDVPEASTLGFLAVGLAVLIGIASRTHHLNRK